MNCDEARGRILELAEGELSAEQGRAVRAHLSGCAACGVAFRETRELISGLSAARSVEIAFLDTTVASGGLAAPAALERLSILGDFEILEELGRGGMGVVYRARQITLNRVIALKVLSIGLGSSERAVARFRKEAQAAARLHHTNIVPVYAEGHERGYLYYAMELVEGCSLDRAIVAERTARIEAAVSRHSSGGRDFKRAARLFAEVAEALHHAHEQGVVHRDIKPQNLLLGRDDRLHITDFGLARLLDEPGMTLSSEIIGTPAYMAPEQITGSSGSINARTDVYSLGVSLYEMLTLARPFVADRYDLLVQQVLKSEPKAPRKIDPRVPQDLETICLRAMEKEPGRRFATAEELARELRRYATDYPIASRRVGPLGKTWRWARRNPALSAALGLALLLAVLGPTLLAVMRSFATQRLAQAWGACLDDHEKAPNVAAELGFARWFGSADDVEMIDLLAMIQDAARADEGLARIERRLARRPADADVHYLKAWAAELKRTPTLNPEWSRAVKRAVDDGNRVGGAGPAGYFFRGQALIGLDPRAAADSFGLAIAGRANFTNAMLLKARASNTALYFESDPLVFEISREPLSQLCLLNSHDPYPRYLFAMLYLRRAELYPAGQEEARAAAYERSLDYAREALKMPRAGSKPLIAMIDAYQSMAGYGDAEANLRKALAVCAEFDARPDAATDPRRAQRFSQEMRIRFWLGEYAAAQKAILTRYSRECGHDPERDFTGEETFLLALAARSGGSEAHARQVLEAAAGRCGAQAEARLMLAAAWRICATAPPADHWEAAVDPAQRAPEGFTPAWTDALMSYVRGELSWDELQKRSDESLEWPGDQRRRMSAAYFYRGVQELAAGRRGAAVESFEKSATTRDMEKYCFRARLLYMKLRLDAAWPKWKVEG
jgi:predicted Ser/Thr protein kinase